MELSYDEAVELVEGFDREVVGFVETSYGWIFEVPLEGVHFGGSDRVVVEREGGRVIWWPDWHDDDRVLEEAFEAGFRHISYDLTIVRVTDLPSTLRLLSELPLRYVIVEHDGGRTWAIPREYSSEELSELVASTPVTFTHQALGYTNQAFGRLKLHQVLAAIDAIGCCEYSWRGLDPAGNPHLTGPVPLHGWRPTHRVPAGGLPTGIPRSSAAPDRSLPDSMPIQGGVEVRLTETLGDWMMVEAREGTTEWVDGRLLEAIDQADR